MKFVLLNSGGKDSAFCFFNFYFFNFFIKINKNCINYIDYKYIFINCFLKKEKFFSIKLKIEYNKIVDFLYNNSINLDYYCNKLFKITLLLKILSIKKINTGHYFRNIKNKFFISIDQKKDQSFFLSINNNLYSNSGFFNKDIIIYINKKYNNICYKKKSTIGNCFQLNIKNKIYFIIFYNIIIDNKKFIYYPNIGKKFSFFYIFKINKNQIFLINKKKKKKIIIMKNIIFIKEICYAKINSQSTKKLIKIFMFKNILYVFFYKKNFFIDKNQNLLIFNNELLLHNFKIKKQN